MRRLRAHEASAIALVCCAATACSGSDGATPAPSATASSTTSPASSAGTDSGGTTPSPSTVATSSTDPAQDPLYLEAVGVYKKYFAEMQKFEAAQYAGGKLPASMDEYITGDMKAAVQNTIDNSLANHRVLQRGSSGRLSAVAPNPGVSKANSLTSIRVCVDGTKVQAVDPRTQKVIGRGVLAYKEIFFKRFGGVLKGFESEARRVDRCPIQ